MSQSTGSKASNERAERLEFICDECGEDVPCRKLVVYCDGFNVLDSDVPVLCDMGHFSTAYIHDPNGYFRDIETTTIHHARWRLVDRGPYPWAKSRRVV